MRKDSLNKEVAIELIDLWYERSGMLRPNIIFCNSTSDIHETSKFLREDNKEFSYTVLTNKFKFYNADDFENLGELICSSEIQEFAPFEDFCFVY